MTALEDMMYSGLLGMVGNNPMFLGLLLLAGFIGAVFLLPVRGDVKLMIIIPASLMAAGSIDFLRPIVFLIGIGIIAFAGLKAMNH